MFIFLKINDPIVTKVGNVPLSPYAKNTIEQTALPALKANNRTADKWHPVFSTPLLKIAEQRQGGSGPPSLGEHFVRPFPPRPVTGWLPAAGSSPSPRPLATWKRTSVLMKCVCSHMMSQSASVQVGKPPTEALGRPVVLRVPWLALQH